MAEAAAQTEPGPAAVPAGAAAAAGLAAHIRQETTAPQFPRRKNDEIFMNRFAYCNVHLAPK